MRRAVTQIAVAVVVLCVGPLVGQEADKPSTTVPRLVRLSGAFHPANGLPVGNTESATLSIYGDEQGGTPLWHEMQNVALDANGQYTAMLGITQKDGVPVDLFSSTKPRWLGVQFNRPGEVEQPRVQLVSVPYALKASDAETLGGKPASAYLLAPTVATDQSADTPAAAGDTTTPDSVVRRTTTPKFVTSSTGGYIPVTTDNAGDLGNSVMYQNNGNIGIGTTNPLYKLDVFSTAGAPTARFTSTSLTYGPQFSFDATQAGGTEFRLVSTPQNGAAGTKKFALWEAQHGYLMTLTDAGNVGIGMTTPGSKLDVAGDINFSGSMNWQGNPVIRFQAPGFMTVGSVAIGQSALASSTGFRNIAVGYDALGRNTTGISNSAAGTYALAGNTIGSNNTGIGDGALFFNNTGSYNTAVGNIALLNNTDGVENTAIGYLALAENTTGGENIAIGRYAAHSVSGANSFNIHIGTQGASSDNHTIRIGGNATLGDLGAQSQFFAAGIRGVTTANNDAIPVLIDSAGQLGTVSSSRRFKEDIQDMGDASSGLMHLRPVTFRYQKPFADGSKPIQYGLIAEEVEEVYPDLVAHSADGQIETVKYQVLDSLLLNEVQRLNRENQELLQRLARLEAMMAGMAGAGNR